MRTPTIEQLRADPGTKLALIDYEWIPELAFKAPEGVKAVKIKRRPDEFPRCILRFENRTEERYIVFNDAGYVEPGQHLIRMNSREVMP